MKHVITFSLLKPCSKALDIAVARDVMIQSSQTKIEPLNPIPYV